MGPSDGILQHGTQTAESRDVAGEDEVAVTSRKGAGSFLRPLAAVLLLFLFLVGVQALSNGIKGLGGGVLDAFMLAVRNPFLGLVTGILATTLVQSSSVTTSLIVGMVAGGALPLPTAIPMVMGANIGTTVTNTIAALAQMGRRTEFRRAFAAATVHDFFNYLTVVVLLPVELATGFLEHLSHWVNGLLPVTASVTYESPFKVALKWGVGLLEGFTHLFVDKKSTAASVFLIILALLLIFGALTLIVKVMKTLVLSRMEGFVRRVMGRGWVGGAMSILVGMLLTVLVQSSSITTSVMVPLAGAGLVRLWQVFPVTVGANVGTTVTALLASMAVSGPEAGIARQIAIVHLLFNICGMMLFYFPPITRRIPMQLAQGLARTATRSRRWALLYVVGAFYGVPAVLVFLGR